MNKRKIYFENNEIFNNKRSRQIDDKYFNNSNFLNSENIEFEFKNNTDIEDKVNKINKKINKIQKKNEKKLSNIEDKLDLIINSKNMEIQYLRNILYENGIEYNKREIFENEFNEIDSKKDYEFSFYS